jgi:hypothetical protein
MRINKITAICFGDVTYKHLDLGPGLNIICGPNGSGKSTWHAALYAGLWGVPDAVAHTPSDRRFIQYRRPKQYSDWLVEAEIEVEPGQCVTVRRDLLEPDAVRVSGASHDRFDPSAFLALDRRAYAATSWIEQDRTRTALFSTDGRNDLQLAVDSCVGEHAAVTGAARLRHLLDRYVGGETGELEAARAWQAYWQREGDRVEELEARRARGVTATAQAEVELRERERQLAAARARAARHDADRLRREVLELQTQPGSRPAPPPLPPAAIVGDRQVHETVAAAEARLHEIDRLTADARVAAQARAASRARAAAQARATAEAAAEVEGEPGLVGPVPTGRTGLLLAVGIGLLLVMLGVLTGILAGWVLGIVVGVIAPAVLAAAYALGRRRTIVAPTPAHLTNVPISMSIVEDGLEPADIAARRPVALAELVAALRARGQDAQVASAESDLARYRAACAYRAARAAEPTPAPEPEDAELRTKQAELLAADEKAHALRGRLADPNDFERYFDLTVERAEQFLEQARENLAVERQDLAGAERELDNSPTLSHARLTARQAQERVEERVRLQAVLIETLANLDKARDETLGYVRGYLAGRLNGHLNDVIQHELPIETDDLSELIGQALADREYDLGSHSAGQATFLLTRIALGEYVGQGRTLGPLLLDDPTPSADPATMRRLLGLLLRMSVQRQVVVFSQSPTVAAWANAEARTGRAPRVFLHQLTSVDDLPQCYVDELDDLDR